MNQERISIIVETMYNLFSDPVKTVHDKTGSARSTISKFFNNKNLKPYTRNFIYKTCTELIEKKLREREELDKRFDTAVKRLNDR